MEENKDVNQESTPETPETKKAEFTSVEASDDAIQSEVNETSEVKETVESVEIEGKSQIEEEESKAAEVKDETTESALVTDEAEDEKAEESADSSEEESSDSSVESETAEKTEESTDEIQEDEPLEKEEAVVAEEEPTTEIVEVIEAEPIENETQSEIPSSETSEKEKDDDHHEDDDEGHESAEHARAIKLPDLEKLSPEELLALGKSMFQSEPIQTLKRSIDKIAQEFYAKLKQDQHSKQDAFIESGGDPMAFEYEHPLRKEFSSFMNLYRDQRAQYQYELDARHAANLEIRKGLIEQLKSLVNSEEQFSTTFNHFKKIQEEWRACGPVARTESSVIYRTYHHHLENFFDYLKLNREVREVHFKKNLEKKEEIIKRAERLAEEKDIHVASRKLQRLHKIWKEDTGPVSPELRDQVWETFSAATRAIHDRRHEWEKAQKERQLANLKKKEALCDKVDALIGREYSSHKDWQKGVQEMNQIFEAFKKAGRVPGEHNSSIWERFLVGRKTFNHNKNEFYKKLKDTYKSALDRRNALIAEAESLKDSDDWKEAANKLKRLQADWKKAGHVPHKVNQETWERFRTACNGFFDRRKAHFADQDAQYEENYKKKEALMAKLESLELPDDHKEGVKAIKQVMGEWRAVGRVPRDKMTIDGAFNKLVDLKFDQLGLSGKGKGTARFAAKLDILASSSDPRKIEGEQRHWRHKINEAMNELKQLEANIQLLAPTGNRENPLVKSVEKNIEKLKKEIEGHKEKLALIRSTAKAAKAEETEAKQEPSEDANTEESKTEE